MAAATSSHTVRSFSTARSSPSPRPRTRLALRSSSLSLPILTHLKNKCATPIPVLRHVAGAMAEDMRAGLASDGGSNLKMILSYVDSLPAGYVFEQGNADKTHRTRVDAAHVEETRSIHQKVVDVLSPIIQHSSRWMFTARTSCENPNTNTDTNTNTNTTKQQRYLPSFKPKREKPDLKPREEIADGKGLYYALDLGGTNFRVLRVQLGGKEGRVLDTEFEQVSIPQNLMFGTSEELFDFIASGLAKFAQKESGRFHLPPGRKREIGFTFSFPVKQTSIDSGILIKWTKGFAVSGTAGRDVVACLNEAMERLGLDMRVSALVNDTVGTLAGARYWDDDVMVAVILGTGTNACYVERTDAIPKLQGQANGSGKTIINTEWGAFSNGLPLTEFDEDMDAASINPGEQIFEKTISGMYLGEIARRVLLKMAEADALFGDSVPDNLSTPFTLRTPDLCAMQQDNSSDLKAVGTILNDVVGVPSSSLSARKIVLEVCDTIVKRGGRLAGAGIVGILQKMEQDSKGLVFRKRTVVAMDGGLYEHYPQYRRYLQDAVTELLGPVTSKNIVIEHSKDGSGIGAALLAAANSRYVDEC